MRNSGAAIPFRNQKVLDSIFGAEFFLPQKTSIVGTIGSRFEITDLQD